MFKRGNGTAAEMTQYTQNTWKSKPKIDLSWTATTRTRKVLYGTYTKGRTLVVRKCRPWYKSQTCLLGEAFLCQEPLFLSSLLSLSGVAKLRFPSFDFTGFAVIHTESVDERRWLAHHSRWFGKRFDHTRQRQRLGVQVDGFPVRRYSPNFTFRVRSRESLDLPTPELYYSNCFVFYKARLFFRCCHYKLVKTLQLVVRSARYVRNT